MISWNRWRGSEDLTGRERVYGAPCVPDCIDQLQELSLRTCRTNYFILFLCPVRTGKRARGFMHLDDFWGTYLTV